MKPISDETYRVQCGRCGTVRDSRVITEGDPEDDGSTYLETDCRCGAREGRVIR
jgi:hypothetical protein